MDWETLRFHLVTGIYVCATVLGFGLVGMIASRVLLP